MIQLSELMRYSLFGGLTAEELAFLCGMMRREHFPPGYDILRQGDVGDRIYFILEGQVEVLAHAHDAELYERMAVLEAGQNFGEMEIIDVEPRTATIRSLTDVECLVITNKDLYRLKHWNLETFTIIMMNLAREISRRLRLMDDLYLMEREKSRELAEKATTTAQRS